MQRSRVPAAILLWQQLRDWCRPGFEECRRVWLHLVTIGYYVGNFAFLKVLLHPDPAERCEVKGALLQFVHKEIDTDLPKLKERLQFYALTRSSVKRWFNSSDGQPQVWRPLQDRGLGLL